MESMQILDGVQFAHMIRTGTANLQSKVEEINQLNVFPIPDGDTGDNMLLTMLGGAEAVGAEEKSLSEAARRVADGMLLSARGNSGVILSQFFEGIAEGLKGKEVVVSGFGNVSWGTVRKLNQLGAKVITISGPDGYIYDPDGVTAGEKEDYLLELRASGKNICAPYAEKFKGAKFFPGEKPWGVKADLYIPCATQNEITIKEAEVMVKNGCKFLCEGSNMPTTNEAMAYLAEKGVVIGPSKAANAGGVACSCIEMGQNAGHTVFSPEQVYAQLEGIMVNIHDSAAKASEENGLGYNLVAGANIAGFKKIAEAMMAQGIC